MPAVFVHGNPETSAIWGALFEALQRDDLIALSPPGFGAPVPAGWSATRSEYLDWLSGELAQIDGPIDLVGHDWGGGHVLGLMIERQEPVRSWCVDVMGLVHADYVWHDAARVWQTADAGERNIEKMVSTPAADLAAMYQSLGMSADVAADVADAVDATMGECILGLYRDAAQPALQQLGRSADKAAVRPGLAIVAEHDHYVGTEAQAREIAERAGAQLTVLSGVGHWWMCQDPATGARALESFWSGVQD